MNNAFNIFLHERDSGVTELISITKTGEVSDSTSFGGLSINADGRFVAFTSRSTDLTSEIDTNSTNTDVFVRDRLNGVTEFVSVNSSGAQSNGFSADPSISADGRFVAFESSGTNLVPGGDANGPGGDIFVHDRETGVTDLVSVNSSGAQANISSRRPVISADGRFVAFYSFAINLVPGGDANGARSDVFIHDRFTGATELASVSSSGVQGNNSSVEPSISADGMVVAFQSSATNLMPGGDVNGSVLDVFVHDRMSGVTELVAVNSSGAQANNWSANSSLNADGRFVAFRSAATNLIVGGDANRTLADIFVHDRQTGSTEFASVDNLGTQANGSSSLHEPSSLSADGRFVTFESSARNLLPGSDTNGTGTDIFVHDRGITNQAPIADAGPDRQVACVSPAGSQVTLDGSASSDPDDDPLSYLWTGPFAEGGGSATGISPTVTLQLGSSAITLVVNDGQVDSDPDTVTVIVADTTPPALVASLTPVGEGDEPGDDDEGRFRIDFFGSDSCDPAPTVTAALVLPGTADIPVVEGQIIEFELEDEETEVESEDGILEIEAPSLTLRVTGTDASGNSATAEVRPAGLGADNEDDTVASVGLDD